MKSILCHWFCLNYMDKRIYRTKQKHKNWCFHIEKILQKSDISLKKGGLYNKAQRQSVIETLQNVFFAECQKPYHVQGKKKFFRYGVVPFESKRDAMKCSHTTRETVFTV